MSSIEEQFSTIAATLAGETGVALGSGKRGFGASALQVNGKIFAMVSSAGAFVVKLPRPRVEALVAAGRGQPFDPGHGRLLKEWLAMGAGTTDEWLPLAREALQFVGRR